MAKTDHIDQAVGSRAGALSSEALLARKSGATLRRVSDCLHFAAAPAFAAMALLAASAGSGSAAALCSPHDASPISGMAVMYALMSAFHLAPWLQLMSSSGEAN